MKTYYSKLLPVLFVSYSLINIYYGIILFFTTSICYCELTWNSAACLEAQTSTNGERWANKIHYTKYTIQSKIEYKATFLAIHFMHSIIVVLSLAQLKSCYANVNQMCDL